MMKRALPWLMVASLALPGCSTIESIKLPPQVSGQIPDSYQLETNRGLLLARIVVTTEGAPGFGPISNPLVVQFHPGEGQGTGTEREHLTVTLPNPGAYVFTSESGRPSVWRYQAPGLLAISVQSGKYDALAIAYPDSLHDTATPSSIPVPSRDFVFAPVEIPGDGITYLGEIEIKQSYSFWDRFAGEVEVTYAVSDNYDRTVADFRARYPQFANVKVERRVLMPLPQD